MSKFAEALNALLNVRVVNQDIRDLTFVTEQTLRHARHGKTNLRRSTAVLFLSAAKKIVERKKRELDKCLAAMENAYVEEFKTHTRVDTSLQ